MHQLSLIAGSLYGATAVMLGAFGAHALKAKISPEQLHSFETAVKYQFYHALVLLILGILIEKYSSTLLVYSSWLFIAGILFFSGSIYLLSNKVWLGIENWKWLGPVTPFGGLLLIIGWILMLTAFVRK